MTSIIQTPSHHSIPSLSFSSGGEIPISESRSPKGIGKSPYSFTTTIRYIFNLISNGFFSYARSSMMNLLARHEVTSLSKTTLLDSSTLKVIFLGDIMLSKSGEAPTIEGKVANILKNADVIVANVEAPVIEPNGEVQKREGASLSFKMDNQYLKTFYNQAPSAKWVFSIANNHACDQGSNGIQATIKAIKSVMSEAQIIGVQAQKDAYSVLSLQVEDGPNIGIIAWTDVMNSDKKHYKEPIVREEDLSPDLIQSFRKKYDYLIGFPHGNVEQSYNPEKKTRDGWIKLMQPNGFDLVVGHGPHVLQPAEKVDGKPLFHSIGNFCSPRGSTQTKVGAIFQTNFHFAKEPKTIHKIEHIIHLIEQGEGSVGLLNPSNSSCSNIVKRLKKEWPGLILPSSTKRPPFLSSSSFKRLKCAVVRTLPFFRQSFSRLTRALTF